MGKNTGPDKLGDILSVLPGIINIPIIKFIGQDDQKKYNKNEGYQTKCDKQLFLGSFSGNTLRGRRCHLAEDSFWLPRCCQNGEVPFRLEHPRGLFNTCHMGRDSGYFFVTNTNYHRVFGHQRGEFVGSLFCNYVLYLFDQIPFVLSGQIWVIGRNRYPLLPVAGGAEFIDIKFLTILGRG
jgi:hypothetical protein